MIEKKAKELLSSFKNIRVGVVGDLMLDVYVNGNVDRISPEAPVPIIHITSEDHVLGGAANVARNIVSLGGKASLLGVIGSDTNGTILKKKSEELGIGSGYVVIDSSRVTTEKKRIVSQSQQILRIDSETKDFISGKIEDDFIEKLESLISSSDIICVADYGKGALTPRVIKELTRLCSHFDKKVLVDAKPRSLLAYSNVDLLTPNRSEVLEATGSNDELAGLVKLSNRTNSPVLMTCGPEGMELCINGEVIHFDAISKKAVDVSGAGDTVTAVSALLRSLDADYLLTAKTASVAASIAVSKLRTSPVFLDELEAKLT